MRRSSFLWPTRFVNGIRVSNCARGIRPGQKINRLTLLGEHFYLPWSDSRYWLGVFQCDCGKVFVALSHHVKGGNTKSCGCQIAKNGLRHGCSRLRIYGVWQDMHARCSNPQNPSFKHYGGRGITVCDEWQSPEPFMKWAFTNGYVEGLDIDRINNNGNYEPRNCRFVTRSVNCRNKRTNVFLEAFGERKCVADWVNDSRCAVADKTLRERISHGWEPERAITEPSHKPAGQTSVVNADLRGPAIVASQLYFSW